MTRFIDITFHANTEYADTDALVEAQRVSLLYVQPLLEVFDVEVIKHINNPATKIIPRYPFRFFRSRNGFFHIPVATLRYLHKKKPDIILVRGLGFPLQVLAMRSLLGNKPRILVKHHADQPASGLKRFFQRMADRYISGYFFAVKQGANDWLDLKIISDPDKIYEQPANCTSFGPLDKSQCRAKLGWEQGPVFLWVGRLNANKDPLTVLHAFERILLTEPLAQLHFVYSSNELLAGLVAGIETNPLLARAVFLHGRVAHDSLPVMYNAADYFISSSYSEGGSVAIIEAMACGCVPVVSEIPASMQTIGQGRFGFFFQAGNPEALHHTLLDALAVDRDSFAAGVRSHFNANLSLRAVTDQLVNICRGLVKG